MICDICKNEINVEIFEYLEDEDGYIYCSDECFNLEMERNFIEKSDYPKIEWK